MSKLYDTNTMRLAELKYYSKEDNGVEVSSPLSLGVFMLLGGQWFNVFDVSDDSIIFERLKYYGNVTSDGLEYGSKLKVVSDEEKDVSGPCWILDDEPLSKTVGKDIVTIKEIEDYLQVSHPTVVGIVSRMEKNGFLTSRYERTSKVVTLTQKAQATGEDMLNTMIKQDEILFKGLSKEEVAELNRILIIIYNKETN